MPGLGHKNIAARAGDDSGPRGITIAVAELEAERKT